jgi:hypothetical protein
MTGYELLYREGNRDPYSCLILFDSVDEAKTHVAQDLARWHRPPEPPTWTVDGDGAHRAEILTAGGYPMWSWKIVAVKPNTGPVTISKVVGHVDVDAGIIQVGDPCYTLRNDRGTARGATQSVQKIWFEKLVELATKADPVAAAAYADAATTIKDWEVPDPGVNYFEMIEHLHTEDPRWSLAPEGYQGVWAPYEPTMEGQPHGPGAGVVVSSGDGDGTYPVTVEWWSKDCEDPWMRGRVKSVKVDFYYEDEEEDDERPA